MNIYDFISPPVICIHDFKNYNRFFKSEPLGEEQDKLKPFGQELGLYLL